MKDASLIVLKALLEGQEVDLPLGEDHIETFMLHEGRFGIRRESITYEEGKEVDRKEVFLGVDLNVDTFIKMCGKVTEKDLVTIVGNMALRGWKNKLV